MNESIFLNYTVFVANNILLMEVTELQNYELLTNYFWEVSSLSKFYISPMQIKRNQKI